MPTRIGIGYDLHRLVRGRPLILGGIRIPYGRGLLGHSDGDALTHSIIDALMGAAGLGDIGEFFPDTSPKWKNASSLEMLREISHRISRKGLRILNVDSVVLAQNPRLNTYKKKISLRLARVLRLKPGQVNIKAKTLEGLGPIGHSRALSALSILLLGSLRKNS